MANIMEVMPDLDGDEMVFVQGLIKDMDDQQLEDVRRSVGRRPRQRCRGFLHMLSEPDLFEELLNKHQT